MFKLWCSVLLISSTLAKCSQNHAANRSTEPLYLTHMIQSNDIDEARHQSRVNHPDLSGIVSHAGFLTVNTKCDAHLYFWFFPAENNRVTAPLVLWLQGGPGSSSLSAIFTENGPKIFDRKGGTSKLAFSPYSWTTFHSVLYIDNPVGTGFSYTAAGCYATGQRQIGDELYEALVQFFQMFPEYRANDFYVAGESYSGKYVPTISTKIHDENLKLEKSNKDYTTDSWKRKINLKGLILGSGYIDPINQGEYSDYFYQIGLISQSDRERFKKLEQRRRAAIDGENWKLATAFDRAMISDETHPTLFSQVTGLRTYCNYLNQEEFPYDELVVNYTARRDVRDAIHVGDLNFSVNSLKVFNNLSDDNMKSVAHLVADLLASYRVLLYSGQLDLIVPYSGTERFLNKLEFPGKKQWLDARRQIWHVDGDVAGYVREGGNLTEVLVRNVGHLAMHDRPEWIYDLIMRFTQIKAYN